MLKRKNTKNNCYSFFILCIAAIWISPFSIQAQELIPDMEKVKKAAAGGNIIAMRALGSAYMDGKYIAKDSIEAIRWYTKAAEKGDGAAMYWLGFFYEHGKLIPKDTALALKW